MGVGGPERFRGRFRHPTRRVSTARLHGLPGVCAHDAEAVDWPWSHDGNGRNRERAAAPPDSKRYEVRGAMLAA